jgi:hypothetical protein
MGLKHGKGELRWLNGDVYKGDFLNDNLHGRGEFKWADGRHYIGAWRFNKFHGVRNTF